MRIYLIRHGQTDWNRKKKLQGMTDIPLNENGIALARQTARGMKEIPFDLAFTSPLGRARQTAELICEGRTIPILTEERIREISFGDYEGLIHSREGFNIPNPEFHFFFDDPLHYQTPPGAESIDALLQRTGEFLEDLKKNPDYAGKQILVSSHGAAVKAILCNAAGKSKEMLWGDGVHKNCGVSCLELKGDEWKLLWENRVFY